MAHVYPRTQQKKRVPQVDSWLRGLQDKQGRAAMFGFSLAEQRWDSTDFIFGVLSILGRGPFALPLRFPPNSRNRGPRVEPWAFCFPLIHSKTALFSTSISLFWELPNLAVLEHTTSKLQPSKGKSSDPCTGSVGNFWVL